MDSWFLSAVEGGHTMVEAKDPLRRLCLGVLRNIPIQILTVGLVVLQAALLNHHLAITHEHASLWYWFYAGDLVVVVTIILSFILRERKLKHLHRNHKESSNFSKGLPLASLGWLLYSILLSVRIGIIFKYDIHDDLDINNTKLTICLTAIICAFYTFGHHHAKESLVRRAAILLLIKSFTIDLLDTVDMLDVLFEVSEDMKTQQVIGVLEDIVLMIVGFNLIRPSVVLLSLFVDHFGSKHKSLTIKIIKATLELVLVNIPLLVIRLYMWFVYTSFVSVFLVKNIIGILFAFLEIYDCVFDKYEHHKERYKESSHPIAEDKALSDGNCGPAGNPDYEKNAAKIPHNDTQSVTDNKASF